MAARTCPHCGQLLTPERPRLGKRWKRPQWIAFVAGLAPIVTGALLVALYLPPVVAVQVTGIDFTSPDDACGLDYASAPGFNTSLGASVHASLTLRTLGRGYDCAVHGLNVTTPGFSLSFTNLPVQDYNLTFTLHVPDRPYSGPLTIVAE